MAPDGSLAEMDFLWPLFHFEKDESGGTDFRIRPLWRCVVDAREKRVEHEFLPPLGAVRMSEGETTARLLPLFFYREHMSEGAKGAWDRDWFFTPLLWGGSSSDGEDYLALFPVYGKLRQFFTYDEWGFFLFPLYSWTERKRDYSRSIIWPLGGYGGGKEEGSFHWWRALPFYGQNIDPGKSESYSVLWPFFHWGSDRLDSEHPYDKFFFFPIVGWRSGGAFLSWTFLWPFFRHSHKVEGMDEEAGRGEFSSWDIVWPLFRYIHSSLEDKNFDQWWIFPLIASTVTDNRDVLSLLWPLIWLRQYQDSLQKRDDHYFLPLYWDYTIRYKKGRYKKGRYKKGTDGEFDAGEDKGFRLYPLLGYREDRAGKWRFRALAPYPWDGSNSEGVEEAYDWAFTLVDIRGDKLGNSRTRTFANLYTSRNFAGKRWQASIPFLFNLVVDEGGGSTLRLFQFIPISWGGGAKVGSVGK